MSRRRAPRELTLEEVLEMDAQETRKIRERYEYDARNREAVVRVVDHLGDPSGDSIVKVEDGGSYEGDSESDLVRTLNELLDRVQKLEGRQA